MTRAANNLMMLALCLIGFLSLAAHPLWVIATEGWPGRQVGIMFFMSLFLSLAPAYWGIMHLVGMFRRRPHVVETIRGIRGTRPRR